MKRAVVDVVNLSMFEEFLNLTYFDVMEMPVMFDLDLKTLEGHYHQKQRVFHPDQFATKSALEKTRATAYSSYLNEAFLTLKSSFLRGKYLLKLKENELGQVFEAAPSPLFLMEALNLREKIESLTEISDLQKEAHELEKDLNSLERELKEQFEHNNYKEVSMTLMKVQYRIQALQNVQERLI